MIGKTQDLEEEDLFENDSNRTSISLTSMTTFAQIQKSPPLSLMTKYLKNNKLKNISTYNSPLLIYIQLYLSPYFSIYISPPLTSRTKGSFDKRDKKEK